MKPTLRQTLIASFLAACGWLGSNAFEDYLAEISKGSVHLADPDPARTTPVNGWFTEKVPGENRNRESQTENTWIAAADPDRQRNPARDHDSSFENLMNVNIQLRDCQLIQQAREYYTQFMQEPFDGIRKYEMLQKAVYNDFGLFANLGLTDNKAHRLLAFQARAAITEWQRQIDASPGDSIGNHDRYNKIKYAFSDAIYDVEGLDDVEKGRNIGLIWNTIQQGTMMLTTAALEQQLKEFKKFPVYTLQPGSEDMERYLDLCKELSYLNPFRQGDVDSAHPDTRFSQYADMLMSRVGMTVDQARDFFRLAETVRSETQERWEREIGLTKQERAKDSATKLAESREALRQCQSHLR